MVTALSEISLLVRCVFECVPLRGSPLLRIDSSRNKGHGYQVVFGPLICLVDFERIFSCRKNNSWLELFLEVI